MNVQAIGQLLHQYWFLIPLLLIGGGVYWWMSKRKPKRLQNCWVTTEDNRSRGITFPVELGYTVYRGGGQAWMLCPELIFRQRGTNKYFMRLDERDSAPQSLDEKLEKSRKEFIARADAIAQSAGARSLYTVTSRDKKDKQLETVQFIAIVFAFLFVLVVIVNLFASGKVHLPF